MQVGDTVEFRSRRGLVGGRLPHPVWHALRVKPQTEAKAKRFLESAGCEVCYPIRERVHHIKGKERVYRHPMISGLIYARFFHEPLWHNLKDRRVITGVFMSGGKPYVLADDDVATFMGLPTQAETLEQERREAQMPVEGGRAEITSGSMKGFFIEVESIHDGKLRGWIVLEGQQRIRTEAKVSDVVRAAE